MPTYVVRVWVPDRPGALGAIASRIGAVRGDLIGVDILERGGGRAIDELASLGIPLGLVVANMVLPADACRTPYARSRWQMQQGYLADIEGRFAAPVLEVPLLDGEVIGLERLTELLAPALRSAAVPV